MNCLMDGCFVEWMARCMNAENIGWMKPYNERLDGRMVECMPGWIDRWMEM